MPDPIPFKKKAEAEPTEDDLFLRRHVEWMRENGMYLPSAPPATVHTLPSQPGPPPAAAPTAPDSVNSSTVSQLDKLMQLQGNKNPTLAAKQRRLLQKLKLDKCNEPQDDSTSSEPNEP